MTLLRSFAILYTYYQFKKLHILRSKYILDAIFFFLLLTDLNKSSIIAQFALSSNNEEEIQRNIAKGLAFLGPGLSLDTIVDVLVIGAGTFSGITRIEQLSGFAVMSLLVNYIVMMTFYPACLSLIVQLSNKCSTSNPSWQMASLVHKLIEEEKPNPVIQRVKIIMSAVLLLIHGIKRWSQFFSPYAEEVDKIYILNATAYSSEHLFIFRWLNAGADQVVFVILLGAIVVKYILFDPEGQIEEQIMQHRLNNVCSCASSQSSSNKGSRGVASENGTHHDMETKTEADEVPRSLEECLDILNFEGPNRLNDKEILLLIENKKVPTYDLEKTLKDNVRGICIRRNVISSVIPNESVLDYLPYKNYDYSKVLGVCCENVIGYMPLPLGVAGPLLVNGKKIIIPMATTEGCLVASTNRGCRALVNGVKSVVTKDAMTRAPTIKLPTAEQAIKVYQWLQVSSNKAKLKVSFDSTSRFARLRDLKVWIAGRLLLIRFEAKTGDAMGMNMVSKGSEAAISTLQEEFPAVETMTLSGNFCTDKKSSAVNWIDGRGKSVVCEAIVPSSIVSSVLKTTVQSLIEVNISKNLIGSAIAGSVGGFNAHAANIVAAMYIACGQDPAQVVGSSNCMTLMEAWGEQKEDLHITVTMPSLELGTVGGGTNLSAQSACLGMLGVQGANLENPGKNACIFAEIVAAAVLAGELSLMAALSAGHLVKSHLTHNRSKINLCESR